MIEVYRGESVSLAFNLLNVDDTPYVAQDCFMVVSAINGGSPLLMVTANGAFPGSRPGFIQPDLAGDARVNFSAEHYRSLPPGDYLYAICGGNLLDHVVIVTPQLFRVLPSPVGGR